MAWQACSDISALFRGVVQLLMAFCFVVIGNDKW